MPRLSQISPTTLAALGVLAFCFLMTAIGRGTGESYAVFLLPLTAEFGWHRAEATSVYSFYMAATGLASPLAGIVFDRFGPRVSYGVGLTCLASGYFAAGWIDQLWQFQVAVGLFGGVGAAMVAIVPAQALISRWFERNMATAMSLAYAALGFGTLIVAPTAQIAIQAVGWRASYQGMGAVFLVLLPIILLMPWRRISGGADGRGGRSKYQSGDGPTLKQAFRMPAFWAFFVIFALTAVAVYGVSLQSVAYLVEQGFEELEAASAFGFAGMLSFAGMTLTGIAADRWGRAVVATASYSLTLIGIAALFLVQAHPSFVLVVVFVIFFGLSMGARGPIITTLIAKLFAGRGLGSIYGTVNLGQGVGAAGGALMTGLLYDLTGGYDLGFAICAGAALIGIALFWMVPEIRTGRLGRNPAEDQ
ncbi:MAG: MFS transporter [Rhodospirillaceae bacterium]|jgi:MFS family permease|nr:MFS transporter [Rhodospirillaceae bacterium]MBT6139519.1 MFS transporter [Rhodospirillaceae bacterium]